MTQPQGMSDEDRIRAGLRAVLDPITPPPDLSARVRAASGSPPAPSRQWAPILAVLAAAAVTAAVVLLVTLTGGPQNPPLALRTRSGASASQPSATGTQTPPSSVPSNGGTTPSAGAGAPSSGTPESPGQPKPTAAPSSQTVVPHTTSVPAPSATPTSTAPPFAAPPGTLVLTESSAGQSFQVASGQRVEVILPGDGQQYHGYTTPQSGDQAILRPDGSACGAPSGDFCTEFVATGQGQTQLTSTSTPACRQATPPCGAASRAWHVSMAVS
jgi:hypothetical protein